MSSRRQALRSIVGACAAVGLYTWRIEPHWLEFTSASLSVHSLPAALHGATLAQLSDLHIGPQVDDAYILDTFRRVRDLAPDFIAYTGDFISYRGPQQFEQLRRLLAQAPHGRLGTVGILGNHDYGFNWRMLEVAQKVSEVAQQAGISMLRNQALNIAGLQIVGLDDFWSPRFDPAPILQQSGANPATLVLSHNPDSADKPVWGSYQGWILSGHTHGGQCKPPFLPPPLVPVLNKRYVSGFLDLSGGRNMYISRGVGHLLRVRFNVRPEVPIFRLQSAP